VRRQDLLKVKVWRVGAALGARVRQVALRVQPLCDLRGAAGTRRALDRPPGVLCHKASTRVHPAAWCSWNEDPVHAPQIGSKCPVLHAKKGTDCVLLVSAIKMPCLRSPGMRTLVAARPPNPSHAPRAPVAIRHLSGDPPLPTCMAACGPMLSEADATLSSSTVLRPCGRGLRSSFSTTLVT
jgi:hypothetical protein